MFQTPAPRLPASLLKRWPDLAAVVASAPPPSQIHRPTTTPEATLVVDGRHLASGYNRADEAALQARLVPDDAPVATVFGAGLGDVPRTLLRRTTLKALTVVIMNPGVWKAALHLEQSPDWLVDERVTLTLGREVSAPMLSNWLTKPWSLTPAAVQLAEQPAEHIQEALHRALNPPPRRSAPVDPAWTELAGRAAEDTVLIVQQVPDDSDTLAVLGHLAVYYPLLAAPHAATTLVAHGIQPTFVIARTPPSTLTWPPEMQSATLIHPSGRAAQAGDGWTGPRICMPASGDVGEPLLLCAVATHMKASCAVLFAQPDPHDKATLEAHIAAHPSTAFFNAQQAPALAGARPLHELLAYAC